MDGARLQAGLLGNLSQRVAKLEEDSRSLKARLEGTAQEVAGLEGSLETISLTFAAINNVVLTLVRKVFPAEAAEAKRQADERMARYAGKLPKA